MSKKVKKKRVTLEEMKKAAGKYPLLGEMVWWSIHDVLVKRDNLIKLFDEQKLDHEFLPAEINDKHAFLKAMNKLKARSGSGKGAHSESSYLVRKIKDSTCEVVFGVVKETVDKDHSKLHHQQTNAITFTRLKIEPTDVFAVSILRAIIIWVNIFSV